MNEFLITAKHMGVQVLSTVLSVSLLLTNSAAPAHAIPRTLPMSSQMLAQVPEKTLEVEEQDVSHLSALLAQWSLVMGLLIGVSAASFGVYQYSRNQRWQQTQFLRKTVQEFEQDPDIWNALKILDSEEQRDYEFTHEGNKISFQATDDYLVGALVGRAERVDERKKIEEQKQEIINKRKDISNELAPETKEQELKKLQEELEELQRSYQIKTELRSWFNKMLNGLEHFGYFIESGLFTAEEIRPWMNYWIRRIADRAYKRKGASKFYDQLYSYIGHSGFPGVIKLFEKFGYRILPTPYDENRDFQQLSKGLRGEFDIRTALSLAKAAYLMYEDKEYVNEISSDRWKFGSKCTKHIEDNPFDTQGCLLKTDEFVVLIFRGTQEPRDWKTNLTRKFSKLVTQKDDPSPPKALVHAGFQCAWEDQGVKDKVIDQLRKWEAGKKSGVPLFVTGHSLGGALAMVAAASLARQQVGGKQEFDNIQGVYTFGQPRVGDSVFADEIGALQEKVFRFVNNNDIVPHIPVPFLPRNGLHFYRHVGKLFYFDSKGKLSEHRTSILRFLDFCFGQLQEATQPGFDMINDHKMEFYISHLRKALEAEELEEKKNQAEDSDDSTHKN